jgi:hypothetical protein
MSLLTAGTSIKERAKERGTFRREASFSPNSIEFGGEIISVDDCWLEQQIRMWGGLYGPFVNTDKWNLYMTSKRGVRMWPSIQRGSEWCKCNRGGLNHPFDYIFSLSPNDLQDNEVLVAFDDHDSLKSGKEPTQLVRLSWVPINLKKRFGVYDAVYWAFAISVTVLIVVPILAVYLLQLPLTFLRLPLLFNVHSILVRIQTWVYKLGPKPWMQATAR